MAAVKVFAVPELLENILIHLAENEVETWGSYDPNSDEEFEVSDDEGYEEESDDEESGAKRWTAPAFCLFRFQRVDKTFKNTIMGSPTLRSFMYLDTPKFTPIKTTAYQTYAPVAWLLETFLNGWHYCCSGDDDDQDEASVYQVNEFHLTRSVEDRPLEEANTKREYTNESWRDMAAGVDSLASLVVIEGYVAACSFCPLSSKFAQTIPPSTKLGVIFDSFTKLAICTVGYQDRT